MSIVPRLSHLLSILLLCVCSSFAVRAQGVSENATPAAAETPSVPPIRLDPARATRIDYAFGLGLGVVGAAVAPLDVRIDLNDKWALQTGLTLGGPLHFDYPYQEIDGSILKLIRFYSFGNVSAGVRRYQRSGRAGWFGSAGARLQAYRITAVTTDPTLGGTIVSVLFPVFFLTGDGPDDTTVRSRGVRPGAYLGGGYAWRNARGNAQELGLRVDVNVLQGLRYQIQDGTNGPIRTRDLGQDMSPVRAAVMLEYRFVIGLGKTDR